MDDYAYGEFYCRQMLALARRTMAAVLLILAREERLPMPHHAKYKILRRQHKR